MVDDSATNFTSQDLFAHETPMLLYSATNLSQTNSHTMRLFNLANTLKFTHVRYPYIFDDLLYTLTTICGPCPAGIRDWNYKWRRQRRCRAVIQWGLVILVPSESTGIGSAIGFQGQVGSFLTRLTSFRLFSCSFGDDISPGSLDIPTLRFNFTVSFSLSPFLQYQHPDLNVGYCYM